MEVVLNAMMPWETLDTPVILRIGENHSNMIVCAHS